VIGIALAALATVSQWEGNYTAASSWDTGDVEIHRMRGGSLRINLSVAAKDGCVGELGLLAFLVGRRPTLCAKCQNSYIA